MIVFTNGCFDIIHPGHVDLLRRARKLGSRLIVGLNSDRSVRKIKGENRPVFKQEDRSAVLAGLASVDEVIVFDELTPERLIHEIKPDVLVKGGDWSVEEIVGADFVLANGGKVFSLPLLSGHSSTGVLQSLTNKDAVRAEDTAVIATFERSLEQHLAVIEELRRSNQNEIEECLSLISDSLKKGCKILTCGNGGSAADAQHIAAELVGRYETERRALPAIALTTDTSALTALANDYDFERIFSRQVEALAHEGDCLIAISTSGNSANVIAAVMAARKLGCNIVGMTGAKGKKLAALSDACVLVPSDRTARIQEAHITIAHIWCEMLDEHFTAGAVDAKDDRSK